VKLHRFYVGKINLESKLEIIDKQLVWQWDKVLRFRAGQELSLFNGDGQEALFKLTNLSKNIANLTKIKDQKPQSPSKDVWLFWSLLKRDNNELILQKCTELGVTNFVPIISERTIKKDLNFERAEKIVIEAAEQSGRADIPKIFSPSRLEKAIAEYRESMDLFVAEKSGQIPDSKFQIPQTAGLLIGPEGGWTDWEVELFEKYRLPKINIGQFTLRAETAAIVAVSKLL